MLNKLLPALLLLAVATEASAQTTPARPSKTAAHSPASPPRRTPAKSLGSKKAMARPMPQTGGRDDIGPAGNGAVGSTESADGKGQSVHAAPGMPINVDNPKKVESYNGPARTKPRSGTTLTPR